MTDYERAYHKAYRNRPEVKQRRIEYEKLNREHLNELHRKHRARNRTRYALVNKKRLEAKRILVYSYYGNKCACCGITDIEFLTLDHKNNGRNNPLGRRKREMQGWGGQGLFNWIIKHNYPDFFQLLCYNCNMAKNIYGVCPHGRYESSGKQENRSIC